MVQNQRAWEAWVVCHRAGREGVSGIMQITNIIAIIEATGGCREDIDKVLMVEDIYREQEAKRNVS